jgi:predicted enzyme related to lactoylglutathione lyase
MNMTMNKPAPFIWYELLTTDPQGAKAFYESVVGWKIVLGQPDPGGVEYGHIVRGDGGSGGGVLTLTAQMTQGGARPCWLGYLYVADIDAALAAIEADGGKVMMPKMTIEVGSFALIADPQGVPVYVMTPVPPADQPDAQSDAYDRWAPQHVSWNELYTSDIEAAKAFYAKHFGMAFNDKMPMGEMGDYWFITAGTMENAIGAMMQKPPHVPVSCWMYYIRVADIDAAVEKVKAGGGQVLNGPMEVPGGDWIINGMDPQGAAFSLVGAKS